MVGGIPRQEQPEKHGVTSQSLIRKLTTEKAVKAHRQQTEDRTATEEDITTIKLASRGIKTIESLDLPSLRRLDLSKNSLNRLKGLQGCSQVTYLTAAGNELTGEGLDGVRPLKDLKVLNASGNRVRRIPPAVFAQFRQLQALVLNNNEISEVPPTWLKKGLLSLNTFVLSHNKVTSLSDAGLGRLTALTKLSISHNALIELPDLSECSGLEELRAAHNLISQVPASLSKNAALRTLDLGHNRIDKWVGLERLGKSLKSLMQLSLAGNPLCGPAADTNATAAPEGTQEDGGDEGEGEGEYVAKVRSLFPGLKVRDGKRVLMKKSHTYYELRGGSGGEDGGGDGGGERAAAGRAAAAAAAARTGKVGAGRTDRGRGGGGVAGDADGDGRGRLVKGEEKGRKGAGSKESGDGGRKSRASEGASEGASSCRESGGEEAGIVGTAEKKMKKKKKKAARAAAAEAAAEAEAGAAPLGKANAKKARKRRRRVDEEEQEEVHKAGRRVSSAAEPAAEVAIAAPEDTHGGKNKKHRSAKAAKGPAADGSATKAKLKPEKAKNKKKEITDTAQEDPYSSSEELPIPGKHAREGVVVGGSSGGAAGAAGAKKAAAAAAAAVPVGGDRESGVVSVIVNKKRKGAKGATAKPWKGGAPAVAGSGGGESGAHEGFSVEAMLRARGQKEMIGLGLSGVSSWN